MRKYIVVLSFAFLTIGCSHKEGAYYFVFDEVHHYTLTGSDSWFSRKVYEELSKKERLRYAVVLEDDFPKSLADTAFIPRLEEIGFRKAVIDTTRHIALNELFREKRHKSLEFSTEIEEVEIVEETSSFFMSAATCAAVYRDLLIFKQERGIIGIAKICFECGQSQIIGTDADTYTFGQSGGYDNLFQILNPTARSMNGQRARKIGL